jgi:hypothetical protein
VGGEEDEMSRYAQWIKHKGKRILFADYSGLRDEDEYLLAFDTTERELLRVPKGTMVPTLLDVTDTLLSPAITERAKKMTEAAKAKGIPDSPTALVGLSGFQKAVVQAMQFFRRDIRIVESIEAGKDWLVEQME